MPVLHAIAPQTLGLPAHTVWNNNAPGAHKDTNVHWESIFATDGLDFELSQHSREIKKGWQKRFKQGGCKMCQVGEVGSGIL